MNKMQNRPPVGRSDTCLNCGETVDISQLCADKSYRNGYRRRCLPCQREMQRGILPGKNITNYRKRDLVRTAKKSPCADCAQSFPYYVMDLDHLPQYKKLFPLGKYGAYTLEQVIAEIKKCEPVCANCHRRRTHARGY